MAIVMYANADPDAALGTVVAFALFTLAAAWLTASLHRPLFRRSTTPRDRADRNLAAWSCARRSALPRARASSEALLANIGGGRPTPIMIGLVSLTRRRSTAWS